MKHLPKHLRPRWRYLAVELESWPDADLTRGPFQRELWYAGQNLFGDSESAAADLTVLGFDFEDGIAQTIVRARRGHVEETRAALACIDDVQGDPVGIRVKGVSGTVRACSERYLHDRAGILEERNVVFENESRTAFVRGSLLDIAGSDGFTGATQLDFE